MTSRAPAAARRTRPALLVALVAGAAVLVGALACQSLGSSVSTAASPVDLFGLDPDPRLDADDGVVPDGVTAFDDVPAVARLDPALLAALRRAAVDAAADGIELQVNSGWRSADYQEQLLQDAVSEHGSEEEAARWVATPETSAHVSGDAVDIGPTDAAAWLSEHGAGHGLCQVYDNEPWHFELRPDAVDSGCPARYADPTQDPRMRR